MTELVPRRLKGRSYAETRSAVLDLIRSSNGISRVELARRSQLTEATISKIVKELLADGVIMKAGEAESTGGKRATLLALNTTGLYAMGVALDVTTIVVVLCGLNGSEIDRRTIPGSGAEPSADVMARTASTVFALLESRGLTKDRIIGIGLATGGRRQGPLGWGEDAGVADEWDRYDAGQALRDLTDLTVVVENDANCAALGAFWSGDSTAPRTFVTVYMGYGIGAGIVIGGAIYRGASGNAGEIGHVVVDPDGEPCWCGSNGCLETVASPRGIVRRVLSEPNLCASFDVEPSTTGSVVYRRVLEAFESGDPAADALVRDSARSVATAILGMANTLDLDGIQLTGPGFASTGQIYLSAVQAALSRGSLARGVHRVAVELGGLGPEVAALGAASVVLHSNLTPHFELDPTL